MRNIYYLTEAFIVSVALEQRAAVQKEYISRCVTEHLKTDVLVFNVASKCPLKNVYGIGISLLRIFMTSKIT